MFWLLPLLNLVGEGLSTLGWENLQDSSLEFETYAGIELFSGVLRLVAVSTELDQLLGWLRFTKFDKCCSLGLLRVFVDDKFSKFDLAILLKETIDLGLLCAVRQVSDKNSAR